MNKTGYFAVTAIALLWMVLWIVLGTACPHDYDSFNFALALSDRFNPAIQQPQPPGYFFHVMFGKLIYLLIKNPFRAAMIQNLVYCLILLVTVAVATGRDRSPLHAQPKARFMFLVFVASLPLLCFLPQAAVVYGAAACSAGCIAACIPGMINKKGNPVVLALVFAVSIGLRQDMVLFMGPVVLWAFLQYKPVWRQWLSSVIVFTGVTLAWFIPTWAAAHQSPLSAAGSTASVFVASSSVLLGGSLHENVRWSIRAAMFFLGVLGPGGILFFGLFSGRARGKALAMLLLGILPCLLFCLFIHCPKPGYYGAAVGFAVVWAAEHWAGKRAKLLWVLIAANCLFFVLMPPVMEKGEGFEKRPLASSIAKQCSYMGEYCLQQLIQTRSVMIGARHR